MFSGAMAACIARTASWSCARAALTSTVLPSVSSAYVAAAGLVTAPPPPVAARKALRSISSHSRHASAQRKSRYDQAR